jgi:hypothetical protein
LRPPSPLIDNAAKTTDTKHFDFHACWRHCLEGFEELPSLQSAFWAEIEAFQACGGEALRAVEEAHRDPQRSKTVSDEGDACC